MLICNWGTKLVLDKNPNLFFIAALDWTKIIMGGIDIFNIKIKFTISVSFKRNKTKWFLSFGCTGVIPKTKYVI